jgi:hypothetical protein
MLASRRSGTYRAWIPRTWRFLTASGCVGRMNFYPPDLTFGGCRTTWTRNTIEGNH